MTDSAGNELDPNDARELELLREFLRKRKQVREARERVAREARSESQRKRLQALIVSPVLEELRELLDRIEKP